MIFATTCKLCYLMALQVAVLGTLWFLLFLLASVYDCVYDCVGCNINELCMHGWDHQHILFAGAFKLHTTRMKYF